MISVFIPKIFLNFIPENSIVKCSITWNIQIKKYFNLLKILLLLSKLE
jgi:hypothetical protein